MSIRLFIDQPEADDVNHSLSSETHVHITFLVWSRFEMRQDGIHPEQEPG